MSDYNSRRAFLHAVLAAGGAWAASDLVGVDEALAWAAHQPATPPTSWQSLTADQATTLEAVLARILPSVDGRPGAREVGAIHFVDRALATFAADQQSLYRAGAADLDMRARTRGADARFATLDPAQQDAILREVESTPFFEAMRTAAIIGTLALPTYGGNRDYLGWQLLGIEHQGAYQPPFGYYDAEAARQGKP